MNRIGLKLLCLAAAIIIWGFVASTSVVEQTANLPLRVTGLADGLTVEGSDLPQKVAVQLEGKKLLLLSHKYLNRYLGEVRVNLADQEPGPAFSYEIDRADVFTELIVVNIFPRVRLRLHVDVYQSQTLPVSLELDGSLPEGLAFLEPPYVSPDSVVVSGPSRFFGQAHSVPTLRVNLDRMKESQVFPLSLASPHEFLQLARPEVSATFKIARLEDRTLANIPVIPLVDAGRPEVGVSPPLVDVMVRGVADSVRALDRNRFLVTVSVGSLDEGVYRLPGQVQYPPWLTLIGMTPSEFQVVVGNPTPQAAESDTAAVTTGGGGLE